MNQENIAWTLSQPDLGTAPVPIEPYISKEYFERERDLLFRRVWLYAGRVEDVRKPGDFFVKEIAVCNASILIVRDESGKIRAFHNVCRHRCNQLVWESQGSARKFTCKFHGWTFNHQGELTGVPDQEQFFDFQKSDYGLVPVRVDTWKGFIFINLDSASDETLRDYLGELLKEPIAQYPFEGEFDWWSWRVHLSCNWKVLLDAFSEAYHAPFVHSQTVRGVITEGMKDNPLAHPTRFGIFGKHHMMTVPASTTYKPGPVGCLAFQYGPLMTRFRDPEIMKSLPPGVNPGGTPHWGFDQYYICPNILVSMFGTWWHIHHFQPLDLEKTLWELRVFFPKARNARERFTQEYTKCLLVDNMLEDLSTVEGTQRGLASRAVETIPLQDNEILIRHNLKVVDSFVKRDQ
ncbi:MAG: aromatic ring-hydroxylating dioxygenase subunit alpha [Acidobacteria bacterium]|nr:aromatic ring-hydroxylating dioxygenase subunit alpha [Acidobacteriota bacterium]